MDIEEATVEFQHPCIDRALAAESGGEKSKTPQARPILGEIRRKRMGGEDGKGGIIWVHNNNDHIYDL